MSIFVLSVTVWTVGRDDQAVTQGGVAGGISVRGKVLGKHTAPMYGSLRAAAH